MPELPEVEITRRQLAPVVCQRRIASVQTTGPSYFFLTSPRTLKRKLSGRALSSISRRGKYLLAEIDDRSRLLLHLGMSGQLRVVHVADGEKADAHVHLRIRFEDGQTELWFRDPRKFGKVRWLAAHVSDPRLDRLGIDALRCTGDYLYRCLRNRRGSIKTALLKQNVIAGVGNIYADEALFLAGVSPKRAAQRVTRAEFGRLAETIRQVLSTAIASGGSSIRDFVHPSGKRGGYQAQRWVYGREGMACKRCAAPIERITLGQRSSHYCAQCQS